jgi:hypothetical protein
MTSDPDEDPTAAKTESSHPALHVLRVVLFIGGAVILGFSDFTDLGPAFYVGTAAIVLGFAVPYLPRLLDRLP